MKPLQYKLIVSDLDGTLVKSGSDEVSRVTTDVVKNLTTHGINFTIATGRSWRQTRTIARELRISIPVIVQAGAIIIEPITEKAIRVKPFRSELEQKIRQMFDHVQADLFCLGETGIYFTTRVNTRGGERLLNQNNETCMIGKPEQTPGIIIKDLFIGPGRILKSLAERIQGEIKPCPNLVLWPPDPGQEDYFLEVFDPLASKGQAIKWLADYLRIKQQQVIAFGDGHNDLDLLQWAGLGVAIEGAPVTVVSQADHTIPRPDLDGIARFLSEEFQITRDKLLFKTAKRHEA